MGLAVPPPAPQPDPGPAGPGARAAAGSQTARGRKKVRCWGGERMGVGTGGRNLTRSFAPGQHIRM